LIFVAVRDSDFDQLEDLIGSDAAGKVSRVFAGESIYIPKRIAIAERHEAIRREYHAGASYRELSVKYGYTQKHIRRIVNPHPHGDVFHAE
jgi:Mor family transcriptional regulator